MASKRKTMEDKQEKGNTGRNLPEDVVIEILTRLPVKSLLRFKRVCKRWYTLIESPQFIRTHYDNPNNHKRLLALSCTTTYDSRCHYSVSLFPDETLADSPIVYENTIEFKLLTSIHVNYMIGPVDGLFLLYICFSDKYSRLALWNPATADFMYLPQSDIKFPKLLLGFGLDLSKMNYKVVWRNHEATATAAVYTVGSESESWRQIVNKYDSVGEIVENSSRLYLNGKFYWLVKCKQDKVFLVLFDMSTDEFKIIQGPRTAPIRRSVILVQIDDSIALLESDHGHTWHESVNSWVFSERGWWTKNYTTVYRNHIPYGYPLGLWNDENELLFQLSRSELILYDFNNNDIKKKPLGIHGDAGEMEIYKYKESLVSFNRNQKEKLSKDELRSIFKNFSLDDSDKLRLTMCEGCDDVVEDVDDDVQHLADKRRK